MIRFDLSGRTAIVTGAAKGIGFGIAQCLADAGAEIVVWDRDPEVLPENVPWLNETVDVTQWSSVENALQRTLNGGLVRQRRV